MGQASPYRIIWDCSWGASSDFADKQHFHMRVCIKKNDRLLSEHAVFADSFTTSLSGKNGKISQIYVNTERNKCVILFQFDDMNGMVTDAAKYQVFIKSFDVFKGEYASRRRTQLDVMGGFYVFGTTGYTALYLSAVNGFPGECYEII